MRRRTVLLLSLACALPETAPAQDTLSGEVLRRLPIDEPAHALPLVPGIVLRAGAIGIDSRPTLLIRGSRSAAANVYLDGAPLRFQTLGTGGIGLPLGAVDRLGVVTGVAPVDIADAAGGALLYATRRGGERWAGDIRWDSDEPLGDGYTVGYNRLEGSGGGPLAGARVFVSAALHGQRSAYRGFGAGGVPTYMPAGIDTVVTDPFGGSTALRRWTQWSGECDGGDNGFECQGLRRPLDWSSARRIVATLERGYDGGSVSVTGLAGDLQQRFFPAQLALVPGMYRGRRASSVAAIVNWSHGVGAFRSGPLELGVNLSYVGHGDRFGILEPDVEQATRDPYLGIAFRGLRFGGVQAMGFPVDDELVRDLRTNSGSRGVPFFGQIPDAGQGHRGNPYGVAQQRWWTAGADGPLEDISERRGHGRAVLRWTPGNHALSVGLEVERSRVASYATASLSRQIGLDAWRATPRRTGVFVGDDVVWGRTAVSLGLRYDRLNAGGLFPNIPAFVSSHPGWSPLAATDDTAYANSLARVFHAAQSQDVLSPRVRIQHAISLQSNVSASFGRTVEMPAWAAYFALTNSDNSFTNVNTLFGRDVDFPAAWVLDLRGQTTLATDVRVDAGVFFKNLPVYGGRIRQFPDPSDPSRIWQINVVTVDEDVSVDGVDARIDWDHSWLSGSAAYAVTRDRASDVLSHAVALGALLRGYGFEAYVLGHAESGEPYTRLENDGRGTLTPFRDGRVVEPINASRTPWTGVLDLRLAKTIALGGRHWSIYADARNLLNLRTVLRLFAETGATVNDRHRTETIGDPAIGTGEYGSLWAEADEAGALDAGNTVDLTTCATWGSQANCVALDRVERRFGDGDGQFTLTEQQRAFNAYYDDFFGSWRLYAPGRTLRIGFSLIL